MSEIDCTHQFIGVRHGLPGGCQQLHKQQWQETKSYAQGRAQASSLNPLELKLPGQLARCEASSG